MSSQVALSEKCSAGLCREAGRDNGGAGCVACLQPHWGGFKCRAGGFVDGCFLEPVADLWKLITQSQLAWTELLCDYWNPALLLLIHITNIFHLLNEKS